VRHNLCIYDDDDALRGRIASFLESGTAAGEPVFAVVDHRKWNVLAEALGTGAGAVRHIDRDAFYTRPEAALAGYDGTVRRHLRDGATAVRVFGELPICRADAEWNRWIAYEAILNRAFAHHPVRVTCGYDAREVPGFVLQSAWETHPDVLYDDSRVRPHYHEPEDIVRARTPAPAPAPLPGLRPLAFDGGAWDLRERLRAEVAAAGMCERDAGNLALAASEVVANAQRHGGGAPSLRTGCVDGSFVCEIADEGPGMDDPLAGFLPPQEGRGGAGLWVARQLTWRLELLPSARGLTVRLWV
jgi:anti-sigma regulatory factor (Ser/Thr protein kinase)